jgi:hypothetical protein
MRMFQTMFLSLTLTVALPLVAQDANPAPSTDTTRPQVGERPADTRDSRDAMVVPEGTEVVVRTNEAINSTTGDEGRTFSGTVQEAVLSADGQTLIPRGADVSLVVRRISTGGTTGSPELALGLDSIKIDGNRYLVNSETIEHGNDQGIGKNRRTGKYVGGGAVLGTLLGAIAGGGKGAAIGAVAGAAAGGTAQVLTKGREVKIPAETTLRFRLDQPLNLRATDR